MRLLNSRELIRTSAAGGCTSVTRWYAEVRLKSVCGSRELPGPFGGPDGHREKTRGTLGKGRSKTGLLWLEV